MMMEGKRNLLYILRRQAQLITVQKNAGICGCPSGRSHIIRQKTDAVKMEAGIMHVTDV